MPQLDTFTYLSQVTWTLFFFVFFFAIMVTHVLPAISRSINVRLKKLSTGGNSQGVLGEEEVAVDAEGRAGDQEAQHLEAVRIPHVPKTPNQPKTKEK